VSDEDISKSDKIAGVDERSGSTFCIQVANSVLSAKVTEESSGLDASVIIETSPEKKASGKSDIVWTNIYPIFGIPKKSHDRNTFYHGSIFVRFGDISRNGSTSQGLQYFFFLYYIEKNCYDTLEDGWHRSLSRVFMQLALVNKIIRPAFPIHFKQFYNSIPSCLDFHAHLIIVVN
jgi:hypothetical protein